MHSDVGNFGPKRSPVDAFTILEEKIATILGLEERQIAILRTSNLQEGVPYQKNSRRFLYNEAGLEESARVMGLNARELKNAFYGRPGEPERPVSVFVVKRICANSDVLECADKSGKLVLVRIRPNPNFSPGMEVRAIPYRARPGVFGFTGAYPRYRGKC